MSTRPARIASAVILAAAILAGQLADRAHADTGRTLPACASDENTGEPQHPCVWVGTVDGNGVGLSFRIYRDGRLKYVSDARARELRGL